MAKSKSIVDDIRKALKETRPAERKKTSRIIIGELAKDIHSELQAGRRLDEVYQIIKGKMPDETKLTLNTFKKYWREAREEANLGKIKGSGQKTAKKLPEEKPHSTDKQIQEDTPEATSKTTTRDTSNDFRDDPDDI